jgi:CubicO group peptidase (beta-lactamase class C family)
MIDRRSVLLAAAPVMMAASGAAARTVDPAVKVQALLKAEMAERRIPGLQYAVVKGGRIVLEGALGEADIRYRAPATTTSLFPIYSCTKAFTGVATMQLVEAGKLDLDAPVARYLDGLPEAWRPITIRQLAAHASGLPNIINNQTGALIGGDEASTWEKVYATPLRAPPGDRFAYCQTNPALLGRIFEKLSGKPATRFMADGQFVPAGMTRTGFGDNADVTPGKVTAYNRRFTDPLGEGELRHVLAEFPEERRTATGMLTTASDIGRWLIALQAGRLLNAESRKTMWTPYVFNNGKPGDWAVSWVANTRPVHRSVGMTGGSACAFALFPEDDVGVVLLTNLGGGYPEDVTDEIAALYIPGMRLNGIAALRARLRGKDYATAGQAAEALKREDPAFRLGEGELNDWGYRLLRGGGRKPFQAIELFKLNTVLYPDSGNTFDSLADAYGVVGDKPRAIENYRRSVALDPGNTHAIEQLKRLEAPQ